MIKRQSVWKEEEDDDIPTEQAQAQTSEPVLPVRQKWKLILAEVTFYNLVFDSNILLLQFLQQTDKTSSHLYVERVECGMASHRQSLQIAIRVS